MTVVLNHITYKYTECRRVCRVYFVFRFLFINLFPFLSYESNPYLGKKMHSGNHSLT